jgi:hypothetical protein
MENIMALPAIDVPTFELTIPGIKNAQKFRPFLVKEDKLLTLAVAGEDVRDMLLACQQVVSNCCMGDIDVNSLAMYQLQWIFLRLKGKSIGNVQTFTLQCGGCQDRINYDMDIEDFVIQGNTEESIKKIEITDTTGIVLKYPSAEIEASESKLTDIDLLINCIEYVYDAEEVTYPKDVESSELLSFIESLPLDVYKQAADFFATLPVLTHQVDYECKKCETPNSISINWYEHFFG